MSSTPSGRRVPLLPVLLHDRARRNGSGPLITYDDRARAERTELSATSFANWVDKTANLLVDELDVRPGGRVSMLLLDDHPGHWMTLVWVAACWQAGFSVSPRSDDATDLFVVGPEDELTTRFGPQVACSLHPLGLGFTTDLPEGVVDYAAEVRIQPDVFLGEPVAPDALAWVDDEVRLDQSELVHTDPDADLTPGARTLVLPTDPWTTVRQALVWPLLRDGSAVLAVGASDDQLAEIAATELISRP